MKWVSRSVLVARPVTLYVRDVPILWLPFIFQDMRPGRHSGILVPQFGINDLVRPTPGYNRQMANLGYYWVPNDYLDFTGRLDWFSNRYVQYGVRGQYRWLNRFLSGSWASTSSGRSGADRDWPAVGPPADVRPLHQPECRLQLRQQHPRRRAKRDRPAAQHPADHQLGQLLQALRLGDGDPGRQPPPGHQDGGVQQLLPAVTISPAPIALGLGHHLVAGAQLHQQHHLRPDLDSLFQVLPGGGVDTVLRDASSRVTAFNFDTPLRLGSFNWQNSIQATDETSTGLDTVTFRIDDPAATIPPTRSP